MSKRPEVDLEREVQVLKLKMLQSALEVGAAKQNREDLASERLMKLLRQRLYNSVTAEYSEKSQPDRICSVV